MKSGVNFKILQKVQVQDAVEPALFAMINKWDDCCLHHEHSVPKPSSPCFKNPILSPLCQYESDFCEGKFSNQMTLMTNLS